MSILAVSYNRPKLCRNASWKTNAITLGNQSTLFSSIYDIFVTSDNRIYVSDVVNNSIQIWQENQATPTTTMTGSVNKPYSVFVTASGDVYFNNGNGQVDKWPTNATTSVAAMFVFVNCYSLFVDTDDNLYCCLGDIHHVVSMAMSDTRNTLKSVAGKSCFGSSPDMLHYPRGIFLDFSSNLYVADQMNHRIQKFTSGQANASTVAGNGASGTITLSYPRDVALDADGYLFIVDAGNNRIVGSDLNGFRCVAGCSNVAGSTSHQLNEPRALAFDSFGNIWVTDQNNSRVQKFVLNIGPCGKHHSTFQLISMNPSNFRFIVQSTQILPVCNMAPERFYSGRQQYDRCGTVWYLHQ